MPEKFTQAELFSDVRGTQTYRTYQERADILDRHRSKAEAIRARSNAIGHGFLTLAEIESPAKAAMYTMMGNVDSFASAQAKLNQLRKEDAPYRQKEPFLKNVIEFNHSVKTAIDLNPSYSFDEMNMTIANVRGAAYGKDEARRFYEEDVVPTVNGMRHESGGTSVIEATGEFEVDYDTLVTARDDAEGIDLWVRRIGDPTPFGIDIKASEETALRTRAKSRHPASIIWSQTTDGDYQGGFRLPFNAAQRAAPDMRRNLRSAYAAAQQRVRH